MTIEDERDAEIAALKTELGEVRAWGQRLSQRSDRFAEEASRMRPVVEAAEKLIHDNCGVGQSTLFAAVRAYLAARP